MPERPDTRPSPEWFWGLLLALLCGQLGVVWVLVRGVGGRIPFTYGLGTLIVHFGLPMLGALGIRMVLKRLGGDSVRSSVRSVLDEWPEFVLVPAAYLLLVEAYMWGKVFIPGINPRDWDWALAAADRWLCLGINPNVFLVTIFAGNPPWVGRALDAFYGAFVPLTLAATAWFVTDTPARRKGFLLATALLWSLGLWVYIAVPAKGPVYVDSELWREVAAVFPAAASTQLQLLDNFRKVAAFLQGADTPISPVLGIAAMPSLHVGETALVFLWCRRAGSRWRTPFLAATVLMFLGSVATGWHWAVDGWAGILLAVLAARVGWGVTEKFERWGGKGKT